MKTFRLQILSGIYGPNFPDGTIGLDLVAKIDAESMKTLTSALAENPSVGGVTAQVITLHSDPTWRQKAVFHQENGQLTFDHQPQPGDVFLLYVEGDMPHVPIEGDERATAHGPGAYQGPRQVAPGARPLHDENIGGRDCRCWTCTLLREREGISDA